MMFFNSSGMITAYISSADSLEGCLVFVIFGVGLIIWSFIKAYDMTVEEKRLKKKEEKWQEIQDNPGMISEWGKVKTKTKRKRRRRHTDQGSGGNFHLPF